MSAANDGYHGPMNGTMRGFPLVQCPAHLVWHRSNTGCVACGLQAELAKTKAQLDQTMEGGGNGATSK
jgi:hypothetical protein